MGSIIKKMRVETPGQVMSGDIYISVTDLRKQYEQLLNLLALCKNSQQISELQGLVHMVETMLDYMELPNFAHIINHGIAKKSGQKEAI